MKSKNNIMLIYIVGTRRTSIGFKTLAFSRCHRKETYNMGVLVREGREGRGGEEENKLFSVCTENYFIYFLFC